MKFLYHHRTMADGAEGTHIREIVSALRRLGHQVQVVALAGDPTQPSTAKASRVSALRRLIPSAAYELAELAYNPVGYRRLLAAIREFEPDVIYDRYNSYSTAAVHAARHANLPLLLEVNAPVAFERTAYEHLQLKLPRLAQRYERHILRSADRIFVVSTPLHRHLVDSMGIPADKMVVLPNGADPDVFVPQSGSDVRRAYGIEERFVIGFVGILRPWHGVDLLLDAFGELRRQHASAHLLIVGDGPLQAHLTTRAGTLGLGREVTFTGRLAHTDVVRHVAAMDIAVSPHATFYASPMKIPEYMSMARPVVAPALDNIRDLIEDGVTGLLFEPGSTAALAGALSRLMEDPPLRRALGEHGRQRVIERLNWRRNAESIASHAERLRDARAGRDG